MAVALGAWLGALGLVRVVRGGRRASEGWGGAGKLVAANWVGLAVATPFASPVLGVLFTSPWAPNAPGLDVGRAVASVVVTGLCWDAWSYAAHRFLHAHGGVYRAVHRPHHRIGAAFPVAMYAVHPVELALRSVGFVLGVLVSRAAFFSQEERMPLTLVWALIALAQLGGAVAYSTDRVDEHMARGGVAGFQGPSGSFSLLMPVWDRLGGTGEIPLPASASADASASAGPPSSATTKKNT